MASKNIVIIGAGPGGLTAALILAHRGFKVDLFERLPLVGGRNSELKLRNYSFDLGPTFLMMKFILDEIFEEARKKSEDYMQFLKLEPMYHLVFDEFQIDMYTDHEKTKEQISNLFPGYGTGLDRFLRQEGQRFDHVFPCLQKHYSSPLEFFRSIFIRAVPYLALDRTLIRNLGRYFKDEQLKIAFTFQAKYLGMSPWECPGIFTIIPYIEHNFGIYHVMGGLSRISTGLAKAAEEEGAALHLDAAVKRVIVDNGTARGVELFDGSVMLADEVIIGADFAYAMTDLIKPGNLKKYTPDKLRQKKYSCSTFMLYLGLDKIYDYPHHTIVFARDYHRNIDDITRRKVLSDDFSFYIRNASINDPRLAPAGHSAVYVLVPITNNSSGINWRHEAPVVREKIISEIEARTVFKDIREHIVVEKIITPDNWEKDYNVYLGATFNLAHNIGQMLYLRPRNKFEEIENCWLVGGGTHPGSGLPTILESGRITSNMICKKYEVPFKEPSSLLNKEI